ncbi:MAG TPA: TolC family protein [Bryobacteraceae bacterium]|jgi:outer membrane protein TolC|nr:TolC family protein [Bryobacteraceae bacterium]
MIRLATIPKKALLCTLSISFILAQVAAAQSTDQLQGSVPEGTPTGAAIPLSLSEAIQRGLRSNLSLLTNQESSQQARAERLRALSALLPNVSGQVGEPVQQLNLQALGLLFNIPGVSNIVGPYSYQEALANATVPIFNYSNINRYRAAGDELKSAVLSVKNARDLVVQAVANAYLQIIADSAHIVATQAEVDADYAVYVNATRRHDAGTAVGIDVLRAQVELKRRQQGLVAEKNQYQIDKLTLARVIGLPPGQDFTEADPTAPGAAPTVSLKDALAQAYEKRPDYQAAKARVIAARLLLRASKAERYPTIQAEGYYGANGLHMFSESHGVFVMQGTATFNIFDGGRIRADVEESNSELRNRQNEVDNLRGQIDYEVRSALLNLQSASDQVDVARSNVELANTALKQSQDRFSAGVTNTVEVVQAQQQVAEANDNLIAAEFQLNLAKVALSRAVGVAEDGMKAYFR